MYRRIQAMSDLAEENEALSVDVGSHYGELSPLITDETTSEAFQLTYMRLTRTYQGGDVVSMFRTAFYGVLRELRDLDNRQRVVIIPYDDAHIAQTEEET